MLGRPALAAALVIVISALSAPALAQPKPANRPPQDVANDLVKQAITKSQAGEHLEAIDLYLQAYSLIPQHTLLSNVGNEYQKAGKPIEALKYFCMYLEKDPTGTNATYATSKAKALQVELGNKNVDDRNVCKAKIDDPPPPPPPAGDGLTGTQGLGDKGPDGGNKGGGGSPGSGLKLAGLAVGGVGLVGVGVGTYYGILAKQKSDLITDHDPTQPWVGVRELQAEGQRLEDRQILLTAIGGAVTAVGVGLFIIGATRGSSDSTEKLSVRPTATADSVGITFGRGF